MSCQLYISSVSSAALKICAVAALSDTPIQVVVVDRLDMLPKSCVLPLPQAGLPALVTRSGVVIQDPTAAVKLLAGAATQASIEVDEWLEFGSTILVPALSHERSSTEGLQNALKRLEGALTSRPYLAGDEISVADISIASDLFWGVWSPLGSIQAFLLRMRVAKPMEAAFRALSIDTPEMSVLHSACEAQLAAAAAARPKLPKAGARNVLITSALPYVNNVPHLGNIIGCVLSADVYSRYCRARAYNSLYICGTDEYGTATETKALEEGLSCQEICDKYHAIHKQIYDWFDIDFDKFGRTPTRSQTEICQGIFHAVHEQGHTVQRTNQQLYSLALDKFLADRYVTGTCPKCKYEDARGDQCDNCGSLLNPTELIDPKCKFSGTKPVLRETSHVYINLPQLTDKLTEYVDCASSEGGWTANCKAATDSWLKGGLKERCITRDLKWGTPVPLDGFRSKVFYVWFDAPIGYLSITANYTPHWEQWWKNPDDVELVQFMGKDNVTFHTIIFPCTLLGTGQKWTMMKKISVTEYLNYEGGKFSKSRGTGVFGSDAAETGIPVEVFRYYLLACRPESMDTDFRWSDLAARNNSELLKNLGNFINRAVSFCCNKLGGKVPEAGSAQLPVTAALNKDVAKLCEEYLELLEGIKIRSAIAKVLEVSAAGNKFLQETEFWKMPKQEAGSVVAAALGLVKLLAALLQPYMPSTTRKILTMLQGPWEWTNLREAFLWDARNLQHALPSGHQLGKPVLLFTEISDATVAELQTRFSGQQTESSADAPDASTSSAVPQASTSARVKNAASTSNSAASTATSADAPGSKNDAPKKGASKKGAPAAAERPADVSRLDLRVGLITTAKKHPNADKMYVEEILCGEEEARVVVSGLVEHVPEADMQNRKVVVLANLKPANLKQIKSHAMVLAATGPDGKVELVDPPPGTEAGDRVYVEGYDGQPDSVLNPKHKVFDVVQKDMTTNSECLACYKGLPLLTSKGPCTVKSVSGATIK